jgi:uncharacterized membrane protein YfcA
MPASFTLTAIILTGLLFIWTGFVRSGLGFGGAALGLPLLLFIDDRLLFWLPIVGIHLLFFSGLTLRKRLNNVDWNYLRQSSVLIIPGALVGIMGLVNLPNQWLLIFIYSVTLFYAVIWVLDRAILSRNLWADRLLLLTGGYVAGTSLTGAPLMVAVYMRNVSREQLRNTLFVLWFILVVLKLSTLSALGINLQWLPALMLLPVAAIGHVIGLRAHEVIMQNERRFRRVIGGGLIIISVIGLLHILWK